MLDILRIVAATILILFLFGCTGCTAPRPSQPQLMALLQQNLIALPDKNFEYLPPEVKQKDIIFLGEVHRVGELKEAAARFAVYLASEKPLVYAAEAVYGLHPFFEAASLGEPNPLNPVRMPKQIQEFNAKQSEDRKILMTTLDIEHSIQHNKRQTANFLLELASRSTSNSIREILEKRIPQLADKKTFDEVDAYLLDINNIFITNIDTFSTDDRNEIIFSLDLIQVSNNIKRDQSLPHKEGNWKRINMAWNKRGKYFKKTIIRAYQKAQQRNAILLCQVGNGHARYTKNWEAQYFAHKYRSTKGKVYTIQMIPVFDDNPIKNDKIKQDHCDIDSVVTLLMKDYEYCYLPLKRLQSGTMSFNWCKYYNKGKPDCDGLLFVKTRKNPN